MVFAGYNTGGYGNLVVIQHRLGYSTWYAHMSRIATYAGERRGRHADRLRRLDRALDRPHLHFEVRLNNVPIDPVPYLLAGTAAGTRCATDARPLRRPGRYRRRRIDDCR